MSGKFFMLKNEIFECDLDVYEFKVYAYLCMRADRKTGTCFPSAARIAAECRISESQVRKVTASLESKGFISKEKRFHRTVRGKEFQMSNLYRIEPLSLCHADTPSVIERGLPFDTEGNNNIQ